VKCVFEFGRKESVNAGEVKVVACSGWFLASLR